MDGSGTLDVFQMVLSQGIVGWTVLLVLFGLSIAVWAAIVLKAIAFSRVDRAYERLLDVVRVERRFQAVRSWCLGQTANPYARLFLAAAQEMDSAGGEPAEDPSLWAAQRDLLLRGVGQARRREVQRLQRWLALMATTGNVSPFIGLLGTVWGIMRSFHEIGLAGSASLTVVAPGISEALLATAAGLFAAVPAVVAYNHFRARAGRLAARMEDVADEAVNLLELERLNRTGEEPEPGQRV
jgi:biopolymer transport protein TolQ